MKTQMELIQDVNMLIAASKTSERQIKAQMATQDASTATIEQQADAIAQQTELIAELRTQAAAGGVSQELVDAIAAALAQAQGNVALLPPIDEPVSTEPVRLPPTSA